MKTDARVEDITQSKLQISSSRTLKLKQSAIGVLRMVKLFGWEKKMSETLQKNRDEELHYLFREKVGSFPYFNYFLKHDVPRYSTYSPALSSERLTLLCLREH